MSWNRHFLRLPPLLAAAGLLLGAVACASGPSRPAQQVTMIDASWGEHFSDLASLKGASDVAIVGTVTGVAGHTVRNAVPFTDFNVQVVRRLHDPQSRVASSATIVVHQTGGQMASNRVLEVRDDVLFRTGETMVLFLREYAPGHFRVLGGPTGRFDVSQGTVSSTHHGTVRVPASHSVDQFASDVAKA
jgi:hypothetical protein